MNAINFIKQYGVEKAKEVVEGAPKGAEVYAYRSKTYFSSPSCIYDKKLSIWEEMDRGMDLDLYEEQIWLDDLKRLVESVDFIKRDFGSIEVAKLQAEGEFEDSYWLRVHKAIADYEAIGGEYV